ncbi:alpha/beta hydrolase [Kitasatospora sp. NPDC002227]|uniref:alpha/beta hydrolase n=1 Tax=Kitasatospora sp. NPDC002227 TaxID=3154773 RepID=UPI00331A96DD
MDRNEQQFDVVRVETESIALTLDTVAGRMSQAQTNLTNAVYFAETNGLGVSDDGQVAGPSALDGADRHDPDARESRQQAVELQRAAQDRIDAAIAMAQEASDEGRNALGSLGAGVLTQPRAFGAAAEAAQDVKDAAKALGLVDPYIPENRDPKQNAEWWWSLTPEQQQEYLALYPGQVGMLDGLPATVRDQANRLTLDEQLDSLHAGSPTGSGLTYEEYNERENALRGLRDKLDQADGEDGPRQLFLLGLDPAKGKGRAIVAMGNPDTADHTAVLVPGTGTVLASMPGQIERTGRLQSAALAAADTGQTVSVISWLGYDAPEIAPSVTDTGRAEGGAADMRSFTAGVRVAQGDHRSHLTVIGHSYGSTAVGVAAQGDGGLHADDIVALGSPGMGTDNARNLNIDPGHVWVEAASDDPVANYASGLTLGPDPSDQSFGGNDVTVDTHGHSGYWDPGSQSLRNQGLIIAGKPPG